MGGISFLKKLRETGVICMGQATVEKKKYTYEDYLKTPEDKRYELIEGELLMTPSHATLHQRISRKLEFELARFVEVRINGVFTVKG